MRKSISDEEKKKLSILYKGKPKSAIHRENIRKAKLGKKNPAFGKSPELRFAIDNGITLSTEAHKQFHKRYGQRNNNAEQLFDFLHGKP